MRWRGLLLGVLALAAAACSDGDVGVRTAAVTGTDEVEVRTDASTTTVAAPSPPATAGGEGGDDTTGPARPGGPLVAPVAAVAPGAALGEVLLAAGPVGWTARPETEPDLGPLTAEEAARAVGDPEAELALLRTRRLQAAYARRWEAPGGSSATLVAYEFADAEGALAYEVDSYLSIVGGGAVELALAEGARGFTAHTGAEVVHGRTLRAEQRLFLVLVRGQAGDAAYADALLAVQRQRLGG